MWNCSVGAVYTADTLNKCSPGAVYCSVPRLHILSVLAVDTAPRLHIFSVSASCILRPKWSTCSVHCRYTEYMQCRCSVHFPYTGIKIWRTLHYLPDLPGHLPGHAQDISNTYQTCRDIFTEHAQNLSSTYQTCPDTFTEHAQNISSTYRTYMLELCMSRPLEMKVRVTSKVKIF